MTTDAALRALIEKAERAALTWTLTVEQESEAERRRILYAFADSAKPALVAALARVALQVERMREKVRSGRWHANAPLRDTFDAADDLDRVIREKDSP